MGLGKRVRKPVGVILRCDPSIIGGDYAKYKESLFDREHLELDPTILPTVWQICQWTDRHQDAVASMRDAMDRRGKKLGIMCSLISLTNWTSEDPQGRTETNHVPEVEQSALGSTITDKWMEKMAFPSDYIDELFALIDLFSEAHLPLSGPSESPPGDESNMNKEN